MPPSPPLCKFPMPRRRAAALPRINGCHHDSQILSDIIEQF
jgi:hypothetical protein